MVCACGCGESFEPRRKDQIYRDQRHGGRVSNRRWRRLRRREIPCAAWGCERRFMRAPGSRKIFCGRPCRIRTHSKIKRALEKARRYAARGYAAAISQCGRTPLPSQRKA